MSSSSSDAVGADGEGLAEASAPATAAAPASDDAAAEPDAGAPALLATGWGSGRGELGRERPQEGNAEGPMSLALANGELFVLDQVNGRVTRYDDRGRVVGESQASPTTQDIAVSRDGKAALLDRLSNKSIALLDRSGRKNGELPLRESEVGETGLLTGVFVDGDDVYVEKEHGALVRVGRIDGQPAEPGELAGRPSRDGKLLLNAQIAGGAVALNAIDRASGTVRFARAIPFPRPLRALVLLDSDARGTIYLGASAGPEHTAQIVCLASADGAVVGRVVVPVSEGPEETMRDFAVSDDGTIVWALRSEHGVEYRVARCP